MVIIKNEVVVVLNKKWEVSKLLNTIIFDENGKSVQRLKKGLDGLIFEPWNVRVALWCNKLP